MEIRSSYDRLISIIRFLYWQDGIFILNQGTVITFCEDIIPSQGLLLHSYNVCLSNIHMDWFGFSSLVSELKSRWIIEIHQLFNLYSS